MNQSIWTRRSFFGSHIYRDRAARDLSDVGYNVKRALSTRRNLVHSNSWSVSDGQIVGELHQTPKNGWTKTSDCEDGHDDWFPEKIGEIISRTKVYCDILTLSRPNGKFVEAIKSGLKIVASNNMTDNNNSDSNSGMKKKPPIIIRILYARIPGFRSGCGDLLEELTANLSEDCNVKVYVAVWRNRISWNHSKIIAVDGCYLWTGGHNFWDDHYLKEKPVHDLSFEIKGNVTHDAHLYANTHWKHIELLSSTKHLLRYQCGRMIMRSTHILVRWPSSPTTKKLPPIYKKSLTAELNTNNDDLPQSTSKKVKIITMGRFGRMSSIPRSNKRASDDGMVALFASAKTCIRLALQDIGPVTIPKTKLKVPGSKWPKKYLKCIANAIYDRKVTVQICLSNPHAIPGNLSVLEAQYGNGWTCDDIASKIAKYILKKMKLSVKSREEKRKKALALVSKYLQVSYIRNKQGREWSDGTKLAMHAKHYIVDDKCFYIGSQNLYDCDLAEWGVLIDDEEFTSKAMNEYWNPMWESSYNRTDVNINEVTDQCSRKSKVMKEEEKRNIKEAMKRMNSSFVTQSAGPLTPILLCSVKSLKLMELEEAMSDIDEE